MSRLIDADELIKVLKDRATNEAIAGYMTAYDVTNSIIDEVEEQPTSFDIKKVVAELPTYEFGVSLLNTEKYVKLSDLKKKIDAIRKGGVE